MADYVQTTVSAENNGLVRAIDDYGGDSITIVLSHAAYLAWLSEETERGCLVRRRSILAAYDALREGDYSVRILAPDGTELLFC
jgi:hypothetical protein